MSWTRTQGCKARRHSLQRPPQTFSTACLVEACWEYTTVREVSKSVVLVLRRVEPVRVYTTQSPVGTEGITKNI